MVNSIIGDTDGTDASGAFGFDKSEPGAITGRLTAVGSMDQVSVLAVRERKAYKQFACLKQAYRSM